MRILFKVLFALLGIVAFVGMGLSGAVWAYGQYGVPLVEAQLQSMEDQAEQSLEEDYPGSDVTVDFKDVFYKNEGGTINVVIEVNAIATLANVEMENRTEYVLVDIVSAVMGSSTYQTYTEAEWATMEADYAAAPSIIFNAQEAKTLGITWFSVSAAVFVTSIVIPIIFLRKKH